MQCSHIEGRIVLDHVGVTAKDYIRSKVFYHAAIAMPLAFGLLAGCATSNRPAPAPVPVALQVPSQALLLLKARGIGVQIYRCSSTPDAAARFSWVLSAPEAELFDQAGKPIIRHFAGPTWEATDGSSVVGEVTARDPGPDPNAIPWLLLQAKSTYGRGLLSHTVSIQRLHTVGGKAPATDCGSGQLGVEARVRYSADYLFYETRS